MKKLLPILLLFGPVLLHAQGGKFMLTGKIGRLNAPAMVFLYQKTESGTKQDSVVLVDGKFTFTGSIDHPAQAMLLLKRQSSPLVPGEQFDFIIVYLEKGKLFVAGDDSIHNAVVSGGPLNEDYRRLQKMLAGVTRQRDSLSAAYRATPRSVRQSQSFNAAYHLKNEALKKEEQEILLTFARDNPRSEISIEALQDYIASRPVAADLDKADSLLHSLSITVQQSFGGKALSAFIANWRRTAIGAAAPVFIQNDTTGKPVGLADFRGKYVLVDFWASWCGPCRAENPGLVRSYNKYRDRNFAILGVSLDKDNERENWLNAIRKDNLTWTHVSDLKYWNNEVVKLYAVKSIPQNFLLDPAGIIIAKNLHGSELDRELEKYLPKTASGN